MTSLAGLPYPSLLNTALGLLLFGIGLFCLLTRRSVIKQVIGLRIMVQGVALNIVNAGFLLRDLRHAESMVISVLVVEAIVIAVALALIVNIFLHYPSGDIDDLNRLRG